METKEPLYLLTESNLQELLKEGVEVAVYALPAPPLPAPLQIPSNGQILDEAETMYPYPSEENYPIPKSYTNDKREYFKVGMNTMRDKILSQAKK